MQLLSPTGLQGGSCGPCFCSKHLDMLMGLHSHLDTVNMQVMLEAFHAGKQQAVERFDSYAPCGAENGAGLSVRIFLQLEHLACTSGNPCITPQSSKRLAACYKCRVGRFAFSMFQVSSWTLAGRSLRVVDSGNAVRLRTRHAVEEVGPAHIAAIVKL